MIRRFGLGLAVAHGLTACASEPPPATHPTAARPSPTASAPGIATAAPDAGSDGATMLEPDAATEPPAVVDSPPGVSPELVRAVDAYLAAANAGDFEAQQAGSRDECWAKECGSFARQAGKKFRAERRSTIRRFENHAQVVADILCEGGRKCDLVYLLLELEPSLRWVVVDVTEDGKRSDAWVTPPGYVEPRMPPHLPPGSRVPDPLGGPPRKPGPTPAKKP